MSTNVVTVQRNVRTVTVSRGSAAPVSVYRQATRSVQLIQARGPAGADGAAGLGALILSGAGAPASAMGKDTDVYLDTTTSDVYRKAAGAWTLIANVKGAQGIQGIQGIQGVQGNDGWEPVYANVADGARIVQQLVDWQGGGGSKPSVPATTYIGPSGLTTVIANATDIRGATGSAVTVRNRFLNPCFQVSQEYATGSGPAVTSGGVYITDGWVGANVTDGSMASAQVVTGGIAPSGAQTRLAVACTVVDATIAAGQYATLEQRLEGLNVADLEWGTASAKSIVVRAYVKASMAGTYGFSVTNTAGNRSYVQSFTISAGQVNTDVLVSFIVPGDTTGTWAKDNTAGLIVRIALAAGSTFLTASTGWQAGNFLGITGSQVNFMSSTTSSNFYLADAGLYEGTVAPAFEVPNYNDELRRCQRYWYPGFIDIGAYHVGGNQIRQTVLLPVEMRTTPTSITFSGTSYSNASGLGVISQTSRALSLGALVTATGGGSVFAFFTANARL